MQEIPEISQWPAASSGSGGSDGLLPNGHVDLDSEEAVHGWLNGSRWNSSCILSRSGLAKYTSWLAEAVGLVVPMIVRIIRAC